MVPVAGKTGSEVLVKDWLLLTPTKTLLHGLVLGLVLGAVVVVALAVDARLFLDDYPPDAPGLAAAAGSVGEPSTAVLVTFSVLTIGTLLGGMAWSLARAIRVSGRSGWLGCFLHCYALFFMGNVVDVVVVDWLVFAGLQPSFAVLPGTEGMAGYDDLWFHFEASFLKPAPWTLGAVLSALVTAPTTPRSND